MFEDEDVKNNDFPFGRLLPTRSRMYYGNTIPTEWPRRADRSTYEKYARLPSWHVEEAASLVAGFEPRANTDFFPINPTPETIGHQPDPPYKGAVTWNALLHGEVGRILGLYSRYKRLPAWGFAGDMLYVDPSEFLDFCTQYGIPIPPEIIAALQSGERVKSTTMRSCETGKASATDVGTSNAPEQEAGQWQVFRDAILELSCQLAPRAAGHSGRLTIDQMHTLIENDVGSSSPKVDKRTFQTYLAKIREGEEGRTLVGKILRNVKGRQSDDEKHDLAAWLPPEFVEALALSKFRPLKKAKMPKAL